MTVSRPRKLCSNGYLHLAYFAAEITLHRRIIKSLNERSSLVLVEVCRNAAKQRLVAAMEFVRNLRPEHLQAFWYSSSSANFALIGSFAALLHTTALNDEEAAFYKAKLQDYRWVLRVSARGFEPMAAAMRLLDIALCRVPQLLEDNAVTAGLSQQREDKLWPMTGVATTPNGGILATAGGATAEALAIGDDDEEGDGQEDFSNETPRYAETFDHVSAHLHSSQHHGYPSSGGYGTTSDISPTAQTAPTPGFIKSELGGQHTTASSKSPINVNNISAHSTVPGSTPSGISVVSPMQNAISGPVVLTPNAASAGSPSLVSVASGSPAGASSGSSKRQASDVLVKMEEQEENESSVNKKQKQV